LSPIPSLSVSKSIESIFKFSIIGDLIFSSLPISSFRVSLIFEIILCSPKDNILSIQIVISLLATILTFFSAIRISLSKNSIICFISKLFSFLNFVYILIFSPSKKSSLGNQIFDE